MQSYFIYLAIILTPCPPGYEINDNKPVECIECKPGFFKTSFYGKC